MRTRFDVVILTGESQIKDELAARAVRVLIRQAVAIRVGIVPLPDDIPALI